MLEEKTLETFLKEGKNTRVIYIVDKNDPDFKMSDIKRIISRDNKRFLTKFELNSNIKILYIDEEEQSTYIYLENNAGIKNIENFFKEIFDNEYL